MNKEQTSQLRHVIDALAEDLYHPLGEIELTGFRAEKDLTLAEAEVMDRQPMRRGTVWGGARDYAWMFGRITLPPEAKGERIVMDLNPGGESTLFLNGKPFGTRRAEWVEKPHHMIVDQVLTRDAVPGETFELALEAFGGTPQAVHTGRPVFPEQGVRMENKGPATIGSNTFGIWNEEAYQLWLDVTMLRDLYQVLPEKDAMRAQIGVTLEKLLDTLDLEKPLPERRAACNEARTLLQPLMDAHNGTFAPSMGVVANSHLDLAWLWPLGETRRKTARTFAAQLRLLKEYPEALFLQSQCAEYEMCREAYPDLFEEIKEAIRDGQWLADGGMWVEPDTNLSGGEALVRQFLYGTRYFREMLGRESRVCWLPDTFGYSAALPQIIHGFGLEGLTTQKIFWSYNDSEPFPHHAFMWKGMDGTEIPAYLHMAYETKVDAATLHARWNARLDEDGSGDFYLPFGYGDGGGGPTRDDMEQIRRQKDLQGSPKLYWMGPGDYLNKRNDGHLPVFRGELYFPCHRGTYTSQAAIKKGNRRCEAALRTWEMVTALAGYLGKGPVSLSETEEVWKELLKNQFHDILPGSSVGEVYVKAREDHTRILERATEGLRTSLKPFVHEDERVLTLINPATRGGWRSVEADASFAEGAVDGQGNRWAGQKTEQGALLRVNLPALGSLTLKPVENAVSVQPVIATETEDGFLLENGILQARINRQGELISLVMDGRERVGSVSNVFHLYRDLPRVYDAWDIDSQTERREIFPDRTTEVRILEQGSVRGALSVRILLSGSVIEQKIILDANSSQLEFETHVSWKERHKLLKVSFDTGIQALNASHQIQFGYLDRPAHRSRQYDADRFEVCCHGWSAFHDATRGAAVLNDCKYGIGACDGTLSLSLLRAPTYPDPEADQGEHTFTYAYRVWDGDFGTCDLNGAAEALNIPPVRVEGTCDLPEPVKFSDTAITLESVKLAEDGSGDLILRLFESMNGSRKVDLCFGLPVTEVEECDLAERVQTKVPVKEKTVSMNFRPFEIKTLRLKK